jgi:hypothetical protein
MILPPLRWNISGGERPDFLVCCTQGVWSVGIDDLEDSGLSRTVSLSTLDPVGHLNSE